MASTFAKSALTALLALAAPAFAQQAPDAPPPEVAAPEEAPAPEAAPVEPRELTPKEIAAFNQAVSDFTAGQTAQQAGDNQGAVAKYDAALPAIRVAVEADPSNIDNVNFLANALFADAAAYGALGQMGKLIPLNEEALPHWRRMVEAKPEDATGRNILAGILIQLGNQKLAVQDTSGADPYYQEALTLGRKAVETQPDDKVAKNILLSALIGASQTSMEEGLRDETLNLGKAMMADGSIDAANRPSIEILTGASAG